MTPLVVTLAAVLAVPVTGFLVAWLGFVAGRRTRPTPATPYSCACTHPLGMHDKDTGRCHGKELYNSVHNASGNNIGRQFVQCECRRYVGEFPVHEVDWAAVALPTQANSTITTAPTTLS